MHFYRKSICIFTGLSHEMFARLTVTSKIDITTEVNKGVGKYDNFFVNMTICNNLYKTCMWKNLKNYK